MEFANPTIYHCPSCNKPMQEINYLDYNVRESRSYSDGGATGVPYFTPDLAKCPNCGALLFLHNIWAKKEMIFSQAHDIKDVEDPVRADLTNALKRGLAKNHHEEKQIREALWRDLNHEVKNLCSNDPDGIKSEVYKFWKENCAALLSLIKKSLDDFFENMKKTSENSSGKPGSIRDNRSKSFKEYGSDFSYAEDWENCLVMTAELSRNLGSFDDCMSILRSGRIDAKKWDWLIRQYEAECSAKNQFVFEFLSEKEMELENDIETCARDYFERGQKYCRRGEKAKALADFNKAEAVGMNEKWWGTFNFYIERAKLYAEDFKDYEKAVKDLSKALSLTDNDGNISQVLSIRGKVYFDKGDFEKALNDINFVIDNEGDPWEYYALRSKIHKAMGNLDAAQSDASMVNTLELKT